MNRLNADEMMNEVKRCIADSRYPHELGDWFFPDDIRPHNSSFKYRCNRLSALGLLEKEGYCGRWGYRYRIPKLLEE